jgi:hypothetical protein
LALIRIWQEWRAVWLKIALGWRREEEQKRGEEEEERRNGDKERRREVSCRHKVPT